MILRILTLSRTEIADNISRADNSSGFDIVRADLFHEVAVTQLIDLGLIGAVVVRTQKLVQVDAQHDQYDNEQPAIHRQPPAGRLSIRSATATGTHLVRL